jgi:RHS repeat-associated protein
LGIAIDANGNTLTDASGKTYTWDFENRLVSVAVPGTGAVSFKYDPFGRRIQKTSPLGTTNYLHDGIDFTANVIEEVDNSANVLARYTQGLDVDEPLSMLRSGATSYFERDGLGSVTSLSNSAGTLVNTYTYDSFGKLTASVGTLVNPFQYTGRQFDPETGLYEYRARYYDQDVGRFKSEDPIGFQGGINFYRYVGNNATNRTDPDGMAFKDCAAALEELAKRQFIASGRYVQFVAHGDGDPEHAKQLAIALKKLDEAIAQVEKYCKCNPTIAAEIAAAVALGQKIGEALAQFCAETEVCGLAKNDRYRFREDNQLTLYIAHADGEPGRGKVLGYAVTGMNR